MKVAKNQAVDAAVIKNELSAEIFNSSKRVNKRPNPSRFQRESIGFHRISSTLAKKSGTMGTCASVATRAKPFPKSKSSNSSFETIY